MKSSSKVQIADIAAVTGAVTTVLAFLGFNIESEHKEKSKLLTTFSETTSSVYKHMLNNSLNIQPNNELTSSDLSYLELARKECLKKRHLMPDCVVTVTNKISEIQHNENLKQTHTILNANQEQLLQIVNLITTKGKMLPSISLGKILTPELKSTLTHTDFSKPNAFKKIYDNVNQQVESEITLINIFAVKHHPREDITDCID